MNEFNQNPMASAKGLASLGRGNDSMLVHMTPREVSGLQSLAMVHGGSLSINPQTGLPEAGFLDSILPTLVGVTTGLFTANPWLGAAAASAAGGVQRGVKGEKVFDPLRMGLDALGGYGGSSLATGLSGAGAASGAKGLSGDIGMRDALMGTGQAAQAATTPATLSGVGQGIGEIFKSGFGSYGPGAFGTAGGKALALDTAMAAAPLLPGMFATPKMDMGPMSGSQDDMELPNLEFNVGTPSYASEEELRRGIEHDYFSPDRGFRRAAEGGLMSLAGGGTAYASGGLASFAAGGRPGVGQPGGYLDGPGDGMSDSIPASIANKQPARLADGEFVIPADVVSHLGNGSSKAGAKNLYSMMDRVRQARTGTTQQGKQINPGKFLKA